MLSRKIYNLLSSIVPNFRMQCNKIEIIILNGHFRMENTGTVKMFHCNTYIHQYLCVLIKYPFELLISLSTRKPFVADKEIKPKIGFERLI